MAKKEERGFHYQKRGKDALKERANMKGGNFDSIFKPKFKQWKPKDGKNIIRVLPPTWDKAKHYGLDIHVNYGIGADNQSYLSLSRHDKGADPIAEARREAQADGNKELAKKLSPNQRILYWIIDRNEEDEGPLLWAAPFTFDKSLCNLCIDEDTKEVMYIDDPENGCDVRFYKEGTGLKTTYDPSKMKVLKAGPAHDDEGLQTEWLDYISENTLPEVLNFYEYDHIKAVFDGGGPAKSEDDDDDEETNTKTRRTRADDEDEKPVRRGARKEADEDDETPSRRRAAAINGNDDDEDETPPRKQRSRATDEDEDEEPAPRSRGRSKEPDDDEVVEKPTRRSRAQVDDDEEDESPPSTRRTKKSDDDEEGGGSLRERLAARRRSRSE
jgi:hypothetical protein